MDPGAESPAYFDVVIVGAGLSGINAAYRLLTTFPECSFTVLEARSCLGGTWSFWQYPGVRSDSNMALYGLPWHPWPHDVVLADAHLIRDYLEDAANKHGIRDKVQLGHRLAVASWDSTEQQWTLDVDVTTAADQADPNGQPPPRRKQIKTWFVIGCGGYYDYDKPLETVIPGISRFGGTVAHPQFWTPDIEYAGKRVVMIGSGATAITMLPALAATAEHVTLLQRSPSYVFSIPATDPLGRLLRRLLPASWATTINWWRRMLLETLFVTLLTAFPQRGGRALKAAARMQLPKGFDVDKHFTPAYEPFEQRLCLCPAGDFFAALRRPNVAMVTDAIDTVTENGVRTASGTDIPADVLVTATGLHMRVYGAWRVVVDGSPVRETDVAQRYVWNGTMVEGLPNVGAITAYIAATWTPGADVRARTLIKLMKRMRQDGVAVATPEVPEAERETLPKKPAVGNSSTYLVKARERLPLVADVGPWRNPKNWAADAWFLWFGDLTKGLRLMPRKGGNGRAKAKAKGD